MWEVAAAAIAKAVLARVGKEVTDSVIKGRREQTQLERALATALTATEKRHKSLLSEFDVNAEFLAREGADELAKVLRGGARPDPRNLATACVASLGGRRDPRERERVAAQLEAPFGTLLEQFTSELSAYPGFLARLDQVSSLQTHDALADERDYLLWVTDEFEYLKTAGIGTTEHLQLPLDDVFVAPRAIRENAPGSRWKTRAEQRRAELDEQLRSGEISAEDYEAYIDRFGLQLRIDGQATTEPVDVLEVLRDADRAIMLGDPGAGKTTLLRYLAARHAHLLLAGTQRDATLGEPRVPVYVSIGAFARSKTRDEGLRAYLPTYLSSTLQCAVDGLAGYLERELRAGRCLILLDGLDEVATAADRQQIVSHIASFVTAQQPHGNRVICSSRISGYDAAPLPSEFTGLRLLEMDDDAIAAFLRQYVLAIEQHEASRKPPELIARDADTTVAELLGAFARTPGVRRLAANPLLLTAVLLVHRSHGHLPERRVDAYKAVTDALGRTWRAYQGIPEVELPNAQRLKLWLTRLGEWLHAHRPEGSATPRDLLEVWGPLWADLHRSPWDPTILERADALESEIAADIVDFVERVEHHSGLLVERAPRRWGFPHLTFEEFYAGRALAFGGRARDRPRTFRQVLHDPRYTEPILLGLGLVGSEQTEEAEELVEAAILARGPDAEDLGLEPSPHEDILGRDFLFALQALADDIPIRLELVDELLERLLDEWLSSSGAGSFIEYREALKSRLSALARVTVGRRLAELFYRRSPVDLSSVDDRFLIALAIVDPKLEGGRDNVPGIAASVLEERSALTPLAQAFTAARTPMPSVLLTRLIEQELVTSRLLGPVQTGASLEPAAARHLIRWLTRDATWQRAAVQILALQGVPDVEVARLERLLEDQDPSVVLSAAQGLLASPGANRERVEARLGELLGSDRLGVVKAAAELMTTRPKLRRRLSRFITSDDADAALDAVELLERYESPVTASELRVTAELLQHDSAEVALRAAPILARNGHALPAAAIERFLSLPEQSRGVVHALRASWSPPVAAVLLNAIEHGPDQARERAPWAFGSHTRTADSALRHELLELLDHRTPKVVVAAGLALARSEIELPDSAILTLCRLFTSDDPDIVRRAARALTYWTGAVDEDLLGRAEELGVDFTYVLVRPDPIHLPPNAIVELVAMMSSDRPRVALNAAFALACGQQHPARLTAGFTSAVVRGFSEGDPEELYSAIMLATSHDPATVVSRLCDLLPAPLPRAVRESLPDALFEAIGRDTAASATAMARARALVTTPGPGQEDSDLARETRNSAFTVLWRGAEATAT